MSLIQVSVRPGPARPVNGENDGSVFTNGGPDSVYYGGASDLVSSTGTEIASGSSATLTGTQFLVLAPTGSLAKVSVVSSFPSGGDGSIANNDVANNAAIAGDKLNLVGMTKAVSTSHTDGVVLSGNGGKDTLSLSNTTANVGLTIGADTNLYRSAANTLKTDDALSVTGASTLADTVSATKASGTGLAVTADATVGGTLGVTGIATLSAAGKTAIIVSDSGAQDSGLTIGGDTNLYRSAANTLKTDDSLVVAGASVTMTDLVKLTDTAKDANGLAAESFHAYRAAALSIATDTEIVFDTETWDVSARYNTTTGRFTPQVKGIYRVSAFTYPNVALTATKYWSTAIWKNGSANIYGSLDTQISTLEPPRSPAGGLVAMNGTTDYLSVVVLTDNGSTALAVGSPACHFCAELVGRQA